MKIDFEGTFAEFQSLFSGGKASSVAGAVPLSLVPKAELASVPQPTGFHPEQDRPAPGEVGPSSPADIPVPDNYAPVGAALPKVSEEKRKEASAYFAEFCLAWVRGFEDAEEDDQPNRVEMMHSLGSSRYAYAILILAYEIESLQNLVGIALFGSDRREHEGRGERPAQHDLDYLNRVSAHMVQVSHSGFPDLAGTYDYTTRWRAA